MGPLYEDRFEAGRRLALRLRRLAAEPTLLVLGLPRGGVPVGYELAQGLNAPLDIFLVRKLGVPAQPELAMGAIASGGVRVLNEEIVSALNIHPMIIEHAADQQRTELERREQRYRSGREPQEIRGRTVVVTDDGLATGASMRAAVAALRQHQPGSIIVAVPVGAYDTCETLRSLADELVCLDTPEPFFAVGTWYSNFLQVSDDEVRQLLDRSERERSLRRAA